MVTYDCQQEVIRVVDGIPVKLALQERTSERVDKPLWVLSWRTKYSSNGSNRRFYITKDDCWNISATVALEMIEEMKTLGGMDESTSTTGGDLHSRPWSPLPEERKKLLKGLTGPDEDWGSDPFFVINFDPKDGWKKVMIVNPGSDTATFRSITEDPDYMPKKVLRPGEGWWLDNSMMDAHVQQMRAFYSNLRDYLARK